MLSVRELLQGVEVELRAGEAGLDHPVRWVHISELVDPTPWLQGGEVLLTTGLQLTDAATQRAFVARLAEHGLAGVRDLRSGDVAGVDAGGDAGPEVLEADLGGADPERVLAALVAAGAGVRQFTLQRATLEDLFVSLTGEGFEVRA